MPLARLELAPRDNPDWILSPTRLPIPPQGQAFLSSCQSVFQHDYNNTDIINCLELFY